MNLRFIALAVVCLAAICCTDVKAPRPPDAARVVSFTANKREIAPGEPVTLTFRTENATEVQVLDDEGRFIELDGQVTEGTAVVAPTRTSFYVLRANGAGGRDSAFVQIAVGEPARDVFLLPVPAEIDADGSAQLLWGAPGATSVTLQIGAGQPAALTGGTGTVTVRPSRSERYTLSATLGEGQPAQTAVTEVRVKPKLLTVLLEAPDGIEVGKEVTVRWTSRGATRVVVREHTFGQLLDSGDPALLDVGAHRFTVPMNLPTGTPIQTGVPLRFEVMVSSNAATQIQTVSGVVGDAPVIERVTAPEAASAGRPFVLAWNTLNAAKVGVEVGDELVFETLPNERARAEAGSVSLPAPAASSTYTVVATNDRGVSVRKSVMVRPVMVPTINSFTLQPPTINNPGDSVTAQWSATNARRIQLRVQNGPTVAINETMPNNGTINFRAGGEQTFELEAYNEAGDRAVATATLRMINAPIVSVTPTPTLAGNTATVSWSLASLGVIEVAGLATPALPKMNNSVNFFDLSTSATATELIFANRADGSAEVTVPSAFHFTLLGIERPTLWVSVNGFIAFAPPAALNANADIGLSTNTSPSMLAPYWDDLTLSPTSRVLVGFATPLPTGERRYVIQWDKVIVSGVEVTFQVQLTESGTVNFVYGAMNGQTGASATIGVKDTANALVQRTSFNSASITDNDELAFFAGAAPNGNFQLLANTSKLVTFTGRTATSVIPFVVPLVALNTGDLRISEAMPNPHPSVTFSGQWVEIRNTTDVPINLNSLVLSSTTSLDGGFIFDDAVVPPQGYVVVGQTTNAADNGGANVTVVSNDVPLLIGADTVSLSLAGTVIDSLSWPTTVEGRSVQLAQGLLTGGGGSSTLLCNSATRTFGPNGAFGTPGVENEPCAPYAFQRIPGAYVHLGAMAGDVELLASGSDYTGYGVIQLPVPFTYYGQSFTSVNASMVGFLSFGTPLTAAYDVTNDVLPNSTAPNGTVAIFWDQMVRNPTGYLYMRRATDRTIISWQDFRVYGAISSGGSKLYFQVHLIDTGVIEFHYGTFDTSNATYAPRARGSSATVWLEDPAGGSAVSVGVNTDGTILQNSGIRFTP